MCIEIMIHFLSQTLPKKECNYYDKTILLLSFRIQGVSKWILGLGDFNVFWYIQYFL